MDSRDFWKHFSFAYRLDSRNSQGPLISTEAHKLSASNLILAPEWVARLDKLNRVRAVHGTTAIEGNPYRKQRSLIRWIRPTSEEAHHF